jgi:hypothetical protein
MGKWRIAAILTVALLSLGTVWAESRACDPTCCGGACPTTSCCE